MALFLVQHGKTEQAPSQDLSPVGLAEVTRIAKVAKQYHIQPRCIKHSGKLRARQTADLIAAELVPPEGVQEMSGLNPLDEVVPLANHLTSQTHWMLVGHLPFMQKLAAYLLTGTPEKPLVKFQNGGIVCLDEEQGQWFIKWILMPHID